MNATRLFAVFAFLGMFALSASAAYLLPLPATDLAVGQAATVQVQFHPQGTQTTTPDVVVSPTPITIRADASNNALRVIPLPDGFDKSLAGKCTNNQNGVFTLLLNYASNGQQKVLWFHRFCSTVTTPPEKTPPVCWPGCAIPPDLPSDFKFHFTVWSKVDTTGPQYSSLLPYFNAYTRSNDFTASDLNSEAFKKNGLISITVRHTDVLSPDTVNEKVTSGLTGSSMAGSAAKWLTRLPILVATLAGTLAAGPFGGAVAGGYIAPLLYTGHLWSVLKKGEG